MGTKQTDQSELLFKEKKEDKYRESMLYATQRCLQHLAWLAINEQNLCNDQFVVACIKREKDSKWQIIIDDYVNEKDRASDVICAQINAEGIDRLLRSEFPNIPERAFTKPKPGYVRAIAMDNNGINLYYLKPAGTH